MFFTSSTGCGVFCLHLLLCLRSIPLELASVHARARNVELLCKKLATKSSLESVRVIRNKFIATQFTFNGKKKLSLNCIFFFVISVQNADNKLYFLCFCSIKSSYILKKIKIFNCPGNLFNEWNLFVINIIFALIFHDFYEFKQTFKLPLA